MSLYNNYHGEYDSNTNGGKEDYYHGEYDDDEVYGKLYIPRMDEDLANFNSVERVFKAHRIGTVTSASFNPIAVPAYYKGKKENLKQLYNAYVYVKWFDNINAKAFREECSRTNSTKTRLVISKKRDVYWVVRQNTVIPEELFEERSIISELKETATDVAWSTLIDDDEEEVALYDLEVIAKNMALSLLEAEEKEEVVMYSLEMTAKNAALRVLEVY